MAGECVVINKRFWNNHRALQHFQYKPFSSCRLDASSTERILNLICRDLMCLSMRLDFAPATLPSKEVSSLTLLVEIKVEIRDRIW